MPCPDCPDSCSVQDELVNDMTQCFAGQEQAREMEMMEHSCNNPSNPIQCESTPDPNSPQGDPLLEAALNACTHSKQSDGRHVYNGPAGTIDECMYGDQDCPVHETGGMRTNFNGPAGQTDTCMDPNAPQCNNACPEGEELVIGLNGVRCEPARTTGNPTPGPGPDPAIGGGTDPEPIPTNPDPPAPDDPPNPDPADRGSTRWVNRMRSDEIRLSDETQSGARWNFDIDGDDDDDAPGYGSNSSN